MRTGLASDTVHGAVVPPIHLSSNYTFEAPERPRAYDYSRSGNPTRDLLNEALAELEGGAGATSVTTGLAGFTLLAEALVPAGGTVVVQHDAYGGTWRLFSFLAAQRKLAVEFVDLNDPDAVHAALDKEPRLVLMETPSNPLLRITDIHAISELAHAAGALSVVDNTFCSPLLQRPLEWGADLVVHSTTKFINGHSDVVGGAVIAKDQALHEKLRLWANALGLTSSAFDSFLTLRGLRTLDARLRVHQENTAAVLAAIDGHPALSALHHPSLTHHPQHALASRQQSGFGSILSMELAGGWDAVGRFLDGLQVYHLAESLGGVESLVCHPQTMTHAGMTEQARADAGITAGLLRLSIGIESRDDLVAVTLEALERAR